MLKLQSVLFAVAVAAVLLVAYWAFVYSLQRRLIYPGPLVPASTAPGAGVARHWLDTRGGRVEAWYLAAGRPGAAPRLLIFTHGNGETIDLWPGAFEPLRDEGISALLVEYPGYGRSEGAPSEASITETIVAAWELATGDLGYAPDEIFAYGRSLGGGAASALARERPVAGLILESTFSSVAAIARGYLVPGFVIRDRFDNVATVGRFDGPVLIMHGRRDSIIPVGHAHRLHAAAAESELHLMSCGHNDCPRPWERVREFVWAGR